MSGEVSEQERDRRSQVSPALVEAFLDSPRGRETLRRYLVECVDLPAGSEALILTDRQNLNSADKLADLVTDELRALGVRPVSLRIDTLFPPREGSLATSFVEQDRLRFASTVTAAVRAADATFAFNAGGLSHGRYNIEGYSLVMYDGLDIYEAADVLHAADHPEAMDFPTDLLRTLTDRFVERVRAAASEGREFRMTDPWGTDIRFTVLPGDVGPYAGGLRPAHDEGPYSKTNRDRFLRAISGFGVTQSCDGVYVSKYSTAMGGRVDPPVTVTFKDGFVVGAEGGDQADRLMEMVSKQEAGVHAILFGLNPRYLPFRDGEYLYRNAGAGSGQAHISLGGAGLYYRNGEWGPVGRNHIQLGNLPKVTLAMGEELIIDAGRLTVLDDEVVREAAAAYGDPDDLLQQLPWPDGEGWEPAADRTALTSVPPLPWNRPELPDSAHVADALAGYLRLAGEHADGPALLRAYDRVFEFDLADAAPFTLEIKGGEVSTRAGASGLDWRYAEWDACSAYRTTATAVLDIVAGRRGPAEVYFDHEFGVAPRHYAAPDVGQVTLNIWFFNLLRLADESARLRGREEITDALLGNRG